MEPISAITPEIASPHDRSYVDWAAILAGTVIATSITLVLTAFGSAIGLSMASPFSGKGFSGVAVFIAMALWVIWVGVSSLVAGAYVTGRMRRRADDSTATEISFRDGAHGLVVWALSALVGAMVATMSVAGIAKTGSDIAKAGVAAVANVSSTSMEYAIDTLARNDAQPVALDEATREQIGRVLVRAGTDGQLSAQDKSYLTRLVASRVGVEPLEVERRINDLSAQAKAAVEKARVAAEHARKFGILLAFLAAASLAIAAAAAWWGASLGGKHRDDNTDFSQLMRW